MYRTVRNLSCHKQASAFADRTTVFEILDDRVSHFILDWELLHSSSLGMAKCKCLLMPIEVTKSQVDHLAPSEPVDCAENNYGPCPEFSGAVTGDGPEQSADISPRRPPRVSLALVNAGNKNTSGNIRCTPAVSFAESKEISESIARRCY